MMFGYWNYQFLGFGIVATAVTKEQKSAQLVWGSSLVSDDIS